MAETEVGILAMFQKYDESISDADLYEQELDFLVRCEELGFGRLWIVEHHFDHYAMSPDNALVLAHLAARTSRIKLGIGAAILPWNDPLRVAEKTILLDHVSRGRALLALGRGLARMEYEGFRIPMSEARERFDEAALMILNALETGICEGDGPFYKQPRVMLRPQPRGSFKGRISTVAASSPESLATAARVGGPMMGFVQSGADKLKPSIDEYKRKFQEIHGTRAPGPVLTDISFCHEDPSRAQELGEKYLRRTYELVVRHYDFAGTHFTNTKGYQSYAAGAEAIREAGVEAAGTAYLGTQLWGTPDQIIAGFRERVAVIGPYTPNFQLACGGMPFDLVNESAETFARKVLPAINDILADANAKQAA